MKAAHKKKEIMTTEQNEERKKLKDRRKQEGKYNGRDTTETSELNMEENSVRKNDNIIMDMITKLAEKLFLLFVY